MTLTFTKMHGLGNDFVVINNLQNQWQSNQLSIAALANRYTGIGFDQLLLIEPSNQADFFCRIFNADGSEAEQCGNGLRCVARFLHEENLINKKEFTLATIAGVFPVIIHDYNHIEITLTPPVIEKTLSELIIDAKPIAMTHLSLGNPHTITVVSTLSNTLVSDLGHKISTHASFPKGTNAGLMEIESRSQIKLRTYERGSGETLACGSNACAAAVAGILNGWLDSPVTVKFALGSLIISWPDQHAPIVMTGPAARVFDGRCEIK
jgi:diaminopimelate epimerase